jgi:hypothetical protein
LQLQSINSDSTFDLVCKVGSLFSDIEFKTYFGTNSHLFSLYACRFFMSVKLPTASGYFMFGMELILLQLSFRTVGCHSLVFFYLFNSAIANKTNYAIQGIYNLVLRW